VVVVNESAVAVNYCCGCGCGGGDGGGDDVDVDRPLCWNSLRY
jgi:hypothetical protein